MLRRYPPLRGAGKVLGLALRSNRPRALVEILVLCPPPAPTGRGYHGSHSSRSRLEKSISHGPSQPPLLPHTIPEHFQTIVSRFGERPAIISRSPVLSPSPAVATTTAATTTTLTYSALDRASDALARTLQALGVRKGDRVAVSLGSCAEAVAVFYAAFKLGGVLVPLNPAFGPGQVAAALAHIGAKVLVVGAVTDLPYRPGRGRSNLPLLRGLVPGLEDSSVCLGGNGGGGGGRRGGWASGQVESPAVPTLRRIVVLDNTRFHPEVAFPLDRHPPLIPFPSISYLAGEDMIGGGSSRGNSRVDARSSSLSQSPSPPPDAVVPDAPLAASDTVNIQFTSGTTSDPKAAMLSHTNILNNGALVAHRMGLAAEDRIVCPPPLFHCFGLVLGLMATASTGAALLFPSPAFDPLASVSMAADYRATGLYGVPTMFAAMLEALARQAQLDDPVVAHGAARALPTHLRKGIAAGSAVPESLVRRVRARLGLADLVNCYGMTETSPVSCMTSPVDPTPPWTGQTGGGGGDGTNAGSVVGRVMPHTRVKVVDPADRGRIVRVGERGELAASGYLVMQGYWGDEKRTREVMGVEEEEEEDKEDSDDERDEDNVKKGEGNNQGNHEGRKGEGKIKGGKKTLWVYSGDEAVMDADGLVRITGRIKDVIIRGGENLHPLEIEDCLFQHPLVAQASVVAVPDKRHGEAVGAFVVVREGVVALEEGDGEGKEEMRREDQDQGREAELGRGKEEEEENRRRGQEREKEHGRQTLTAEEVREWVRTRLSRQMAPEHVFWIDEFPKTASGKIQKFKLREMATALMGEKKGQQE